MRIVIVTGLSGAGKTTALRTLEDIGYYCVDNMPLPLTSDLAGLLRETHEDVGAAIAVDARQAVYLDSYGQEIQHLADAGHAVEVLFLEADDKVLLRRYSETRRKHPLAGEDIREGIRRDRERLSELRDGATVVNTGSFNVHQMRAFVLERYGQADRHLAVTMMSFGYKYGLPPEADLVFDVRFLPNPHFEPALKPLTGEDKAVADYVLTSDLGQQLFERLRGLLEFTLPQFEREGKSYLTVAIGCTGGRHRSVALVEALSHAVTGDWNVSVRHRDVGRGSVGGT